MKNQTRIEMDKYDTLEKIVTQLESCNFQCKAGNLTRNVAFLKLKEMASTPRDKILNEVLQERIRQDTKWGIQNHSIIEWQPILMEEVGEAAKEAVDFYFENPFINAVGEMQPVLKNDVVQSIRLENYRKELIQVAAVAISMVECQDRLEVQKKHS